MAGTTRRAAAGPGDEIRIGSVARENFTRVVNRQEWVNKFITASLVFGAQFFAYAIRYTLNIVAPALMTLYHLSP